MGNIKMIPGIGMVAAAFAELAVLQNRLLVAERRGGNIQGNRIKGSQHPHVGNNGRIVFRMAVAIGGNIADQGNMEGRAPIQNRLGIFRNLIV